MTAVQPSCHQLSDYNCAILFQCDRRLRREDSKKVPASDLEKRQLLQRSFPRFLKQKIFGSLAYQGFVKHVSFGILAIQVLLNALALAT